MRFRTVSAVFVCIALALVASAPVSDASLPHVSTTMTGVDAGDGGVANLAIDVPHNKVCFRIDFHFVRSENTWFAGLWETLPNGPVAPNLFGPSGSTAPSPIKGCVKKVGRTKLRKLVRHPGLFDVRMSTSPNGHTVQGSLHRGRTTP